MQLPKELFLLMNFLRKLPGIGTKTAERFAFELLQWPQNELDQFSQLLRALLQNVVACSDCGCLTDRGHCRFCERVKTPSLCIIASAKDAYSIEETKTFFGFYHVIEHLLSPLDHRHVSTVRIDRIVERIRKHAIQEVIIAFDSTLEGDTTALYLKEQLSPLAIKITRLAFGIPLGSALDHIDGGTLSRAFAGRQIL
jgi:recombination protein RecR